MISKGNHTRDQAESTEGKYLAIISLILSISCKRTARAVLTGMCYSAGSAMRHGSSSL
ncbi:5'-nucleotidase, partial [Escherichia coli]